jgi:hypothetical protein
MRRLIFVAAIMLATSPALAWSAIDRMRTAQAIGSVLASEEFCGLSYNHEAIAGHIEKIVPADDMEFAGTLRMMTDGAGYELDSMSGSQKAAHCAQIRRVAKSYGFTD